MKHFFKYRNEIFFSAIFGLAIFFIGYSIGRDYKTEEDKIALFLSNTSTSTVKVDFGTFWEAWNIINENFVSISTSTEKVSDQDRVYGAIQGMTAAMGDPYTTFFPPAETKSFDEEIAGQIEGVGMQVDMKDGIVTVISPVKDSPAYKAGIKAGDKILKINDTFTDNLSVEEAVKLIRGKRGTSVNLVLGRSGVSKPIEISVVRDYINLPTVETEKKDGVFILRLYTFSAISPNLFRDALREFWESGYDKLIVDLRGNPGGYLEAAQDIASWFLPVGQTIVKEDFIGDKDDIEFKSRGYNIFDEQKLKLAVLIDGGSASASEILAGALHDHGIATLVGSKSFGKGSVQELFSITEVPKTSLKVTIAKWLTPNGISISHQGLTPDVEVKLDEEKFKDGIDSQLNKAIEILNK
ncbi:MAG TPA: S41 family peptidase [Candidatus Paceibacterota bacterium]